MDELTAAQQENRPGPAPAVPQQHTWVGDPTAEGFDPEHPEASSPDYQAQVNMECHRMGRLEVDQETGNTYWTTVCGKVVGSEMLRTTDVEDDVTCLQCAA